MYRGAKMTAPKVARGSPGGRQGVARGSPGGRHPCVTPKIYHRRPKSPPMELILELLDTNFAAQVPIFDHLVVIFMFFDRIFMILRNLEQIFKGFSLPRPRFFAILYSKSEGFCMLQRIAS